MNAEVLRARQAPLKDKYREDPDSAFVTFRASGTVQPETLSCEVPTHAGPVTAGLHSAAGGDGLQGCSGDMLLESLVACAGVTLTAVATAMAIQLQSAKIHAEADLDFRGTLGVDRSGPVGIQHVRLRFEIQSPADPAAIKKLIELTERYCVIYQTLKNPPALETIVG
jgi:uncharacterized OsmC-like protein